MLYKRFCGGYGLAASVAVALAGLVFEAKIMVDGTRGRINEVEGNEPSNGRGRFYSDMGGSSDTD